jgi:lysophospholipase L1-like esterase
VRWVGGISYEMYLWHWPSYLVVTSARTGLNGLTLLAVRLSIVVVLAWATHVLVDEPIRLRRWLRSPRLALAAAVVVVMAVGVGAFAATVGAEPALSGKVGQVADRGGPPTTTPAAPLKVLMVGDSQAATLAQGIHADPGVYGVSAQPGLAVWNRAILGCPIISAPTFVIDGNHADNKCGGVGFWQRQWAQDVATFRPDAVVAMAGAWDVFDVALPTGGTIRPGDPAWSALYEKDVSELFDTLSANGAAVVGIKPPCWGNSQVIGTDAQRFERTDPVRVAAIDAVWEQVARAHGAKLLDLNDVLCPGGKSDPSVRPDGAHFDGNGSNRVAPAVARAVRQAVSRAQAARAVSPVGT